MRNIRSEALRHHLAYSITATRSFSNMLDTLLAHLHQYLLHSLRGCPIYRTTTTLSTLFPVHLHTAPIIHPLALRRKPV